MYEVKPVPDGDHGEIVMWLLRRCIIEKYRGGRARPDGSLAPEGTFAGRGEWAEPDGVLMTVEVTSYDPDTDRCDRVEKRDACAAAGIPVHLLADRDDHSVTVHSEPEGGPYRSRTTRPYTAVVKIPDPVGITLETGKPKDRA